MTIPGYCVNNTSNLRLQFPHLQLGEFTDYLGGWFILLMVGDLGLRIQPLGLILNCGNSPHPALFLPKPAQERGKPHNETKEKTTKTKEGQGVSWSRLNHRWQSRYFKEKDIGKKKKKETKGGNKRKGRAPPTAGTSWGTGDKHGHTRGLLLILPNRRAGLFYGQLFSYSSMCKSAL